MFKVFVSYSTNDLSNVSLLKQSLNGTGIEVFVAEHSVLPGSALGATITQAIASSDLFVLLWSKNAQASEWVLQEIGQAHSLRKSILPLVLTEGLDLPGFIKDLKYLPVYKNCEQAMQQARNIILQLFQKKHQTQLAQQKQNQNEDLALLGVGIGIGALLVWAFSQK